MRDLTLDLTAAGGAAQRRSLRALGHSHHSMRLAVERDEAQKIGRSWLTLPDVDPAIRAALSSRGFVGGATALQSYGIWVTHDPGLQIATRPHANPGPAAGGLRIWGSFELDDNGWRVSVLHALEQHCARVAKEHAIASIDSALHHGLLREQDLDRLFELLPQRCASWRRQLDASAESGLESLVRVPCRDRGWLVESQVPAPGGGRSDLLIDGWLYVEADGSEWHDNAKQAAKDRRRNSAVTAAGGRWLRFGYADVVHRTGRTLDAIELVLSQGRPRMLSAG